VGSPPPGAQCNDNELYDPERETCIPEYQSPSVEPDASDSMPDDDAPTDAGGTTPDPTSPDTGNDAGEEADSGRNCDKDRDNSKAEACGGNDCDDNDRSRSGNRFEVCDSIDHDCDGKPRGGIDCSFFAHEGETLYRVNPFEKTAKEIQGDLPGLHDLDTHPNGALYGVTPDGIYVYEPSRSSSSGTGSPSCDTPSDVSDKWKRIKCFEGENGGDSPSWAPESPQGLAIARLNRPGSGKDEGGATMFLISNDQLYKATKYNSNEYNRVRPSEKPMGTDPNNGRKYRASGDCVTRKRNLYMTSKHDPNRQKDYLVTLNRATGEATNPRPIVDADDSNQSYGQVFGLTQAWGTLYGLTADGELISIDPQTGKADLVARFEDRAWWGAASTPRRDGNIK
jgi:hypothetical protein